MSEYATGSGAHANQVKALRGAAGLRMRIGDFRVLFQETDSMITVVTIGPRGRVYD
jgi:mRNA interferase RelE/StbE